MKNISSRDLPCSWHVSAASCRNKFRRMNILVLSTVAAVSLSLMGCGSPPLRVYEPLDDYNFGTIAVMPGAPFTPEELTRPPAGAGEGARAGAEEATSSAFQEVLARCGGIGLVAMLVGADPMASVAFVGACTLIVTPVAAIVTMPIYAIIGASNAESKESVMKIHDSITKLADEIKLSNTVTQLVFKMAQSQTSFSVRQEDKVSDLMQLSANGVDTVLEIAVTELDFVRTRDGIAFFVEARSRLIRSKDAKVLEEYKTGYGRVLNSYSAWGANDAQAFRETLIRACEEIAESVMAEHLLVLRTDGDTLRAKSPVQRNNKGLDALVWDSFVTPNDYAFVSAESRRPLLQWESLESLLARVSSPPKSLPRNVTYELRIYRATDDGLAKLPGPLVYTRNGLPSPEHALEEDLDPCGYYYWTVRAHFVLDRRNRTTKFSSLWKSEGEFDKDSGNKGNFPFRTRSGFYYRFHAGTKHACEQQGGHP